MRSMMFRSRRWTFLVGLLGLALFVFTAASFLQPAQAAPSFGRSAASGGRTGLSRLLGVEDGGNGGIALSGRPLARPNRPWVSPTLPW